MVIFTTKKDFMILSLCFLLCLLLSAPSAHAASTCTVSATSMNFSGYDVFSPVPDDSTATITVTCAAPWPNVVIAIGQSSGSGVFNPRKMKKISGADTLNYNVFTDAGMSVIWGDGTSGTQAVVHNPNKKTIPETVYARIFSGQDVSAGPYSDTLTVTITW